jgi:hypothetical protein
MSATCGELASRNDQVADDARRVGGSDRRRNCERGQRRAPACALLVHAVTAQVVPVSGTNVVTATLTPAACNRSQPYLMVACIQLQGSDGPGQCAQGEGVLPAQVYYQPYRPGATYPSSGRGCSSTGNPPRPICQPAGPYTATL